MRAFVGAALGIVITVGACARPTAPPARPVAPVEDKAYAGCPMNRQIDLWLTAGEHGEPPWPAPHSPVTVRDAYCTVEQNRVLDPGVACLDVRECDELAGHEEHVIACSAAPTERYRTFQATTWEVALKGVANADQEWRTRLGQCFSPTYGAATPAELAAYERAFKDIDGDIGDRGEGALLELWPAPPDGAYQRVFFSFAREVTQMRGGLRAKAIVWTHAFSAVVRARKIAELPYIDTTTGSQFGFPGHTTTKANASVAVKYCSALHDDPATARFAGDDPVVVAAARRNDAILALARGEEAARDALIGMDDELVDRGTKEQLAKPGWSFRDPCAP